jgi:NADH dehydrogenase
MPTESRSPHRIVIIGGGFTGLYAAQALRDAPVEVTLIDKRNFHLFQPLLYQVATGGLSPGDISSPLRAVLSKCRNTKVLMDEVTDIDPSTHTVTLRHDTVTYDSLIVATGVSHHYFGNEHWSEQAPGLKTIEDALEMRRRIFLAFEAAEREPDPVKRQAWLNFVVVGGGPTGVELAGALAELAYGTLKSDFRSIDTSETKILLVEGMDRLLPPYPPDLSIQAEAALQGLGVTIQTGTFVTQIEKGMVTMKQGDRIQQVAARTVLWAAGVKASAMGKVLSDRAGAELDRVGRVIVNADFSIPNHPDIYVVGDLANYAHLGGKPLPGTGAVAMQQGSYIARHLKAKLRNKTPKPFKYFDAGSLAVIGRNAAVARLGNFHFAGFPAWLIWVFIHIYYLVEFDNKLVVMIQWAWNYFTRKQGTRLITGNVLPPIDPDDPENTEAPDAIADPAVTPTAKPPVVKV